MSHASQKSRGWQDVLIGRSGNTRKLLREHACMLIVIYMLYTDDMIISTVNLDFNVSLMKK